MIFPVALLFVAVVVVVLYRHLGGRRDRGTLWRSTVSIGLTIGLTRAAMACIGWYGVEHTGGPLQIPAFALAMLALPEAAVLPHSRVLAASPAFYISLALTLVASSLLLVTLIAVAVDRKRERD